MAKKLASSSTVWRLASDLGLQVVPDAMSAIIAYCDRRIRDFLKDFPQVSSLAELLEIVANKVGTSFEIVRDDADLSRIFDSYTGRGEPAFANLRQELSAATLFGITIRLTRREEFELPYVSVIDCRGSKAARTYFTKWHEVGHLLLLTDQTRLQFRRTHSHLDERDPEEALVDVVAGRFAFYAPLLQRKANGEPSFERIERLRQELCPAASQLAALIGIATAWSDPLLLIRAEPAFRKAEEQMAGQHGFDFAPKPKAALRAVKITSNENARQRGLLIHSNMRVPERSVIHAVFKNGFGHDSADEDLSWWEATDGTVLPQRAVRVEARYLAGGVDALVSDVPHNAKKVS